MVTERLSRSSARIAMIPQTADVARGPGQVATCVVSTLKGRYGGFLDGAFLDPRSHRPRLLRRRLGRLRPRRRMERPRQGRPERANGHLSRAVDAADARAR